MVISSNFFEATNTVFNIIIENKTFSITMPRCWISKGVAETINELRELLGLREQNHIESHVKEVEKRGNQTKTGDKVNKISDLDTHKNEINKELKNVELNDLDIWLLDWN